MPINYLPDLRFIPDSYTNITAATPLNDGVSLGSFLNGISLDYMPDLADRKQLVRNLDGGKNQPRSSNEFDGAILFLLCNRLLLHLFHHSSTR